MSTIVHVTAPAGFGGLESVVSGLSVATADRGHGVVLVAVLEPGVALPSWAVQIGQTGVTVETLHVATRAYCSERRQVLALVNKHAADVVHTHGYRSDVIDGSFLRREGFPVVSTAHGFIRSDFRGRLYTRLQLRALRRFDAVVGVSERLCSELRSAGVPRNRVVHISNGFIPPAESPLERRVARERLGLPQDGRVIGWVGRVSHEKGPDVMIEAMRLLRDEATVLCMVGDGPELSRMRSAVDRHALRHRVLFAGAVANAKSVLRAFDVLALSSRTEGLPMVLLEAASAKVPIVASAVGGIPSLLDSDGGLLVRPDDPQELAAALDAVFANPSGAAERVIALLGRLAASAKKDDWIARYESLYERLKSGTSPTTHPS